MHGFKQIDVCVRPYGATHTGAHTPRPVRPTQPKHEHRQCGTFTLVHTGSGWQRASAPCQGPFTHTHPPKHNHTTVVWGSCGPTQCDLSALQWIFRRKTGRVVNGDGRRAPVWRTKGVFPGCYQHSPHIMPFEAVVRELQNSSSAGNHSSSDQATAKVSRPHSAFCRCTGLRNKGMCGGGRKHCCNGVASREKRQGNTKRETPLKRRCS